MKQKLLILLLPAFLYITGINAQNVRFPLYNPNGNNTGVKDQNTTESLVYSWDSTLGSVQKQVNASNQNFNAFIQNYQTYLDSERSAIYPQVKKGKLNTSNFQPYINNKKLALVELYNNFSNNKNNLKTPKRLFPTYNAPTCDSACTNMNFITGDFTGWYGYYEVNSSGVNNFNFTGITGGYLGAVNKACFDPNTSSYQMHITTGGNDYLLQTYARISMSQVSPWGFGNSVMLGDSTIPNSGMAILSQKFQVTAVTNSITYAYAILIENPSSHSYHEQPFFSVTLFDSSGDTISNCGKYFVSAGPGLPGFKGIWYSPEGDTVYWRNWTQVNVPLDKYVGQCVTIQFMVGDCSLGGHFGYAYVDASCEQFSIKASSPTGIICGRHGTVTLSGPFGASAYQWSGPKGGILSSDTIENITVDSAGQYTLILTPVTGDLCQDTLHYTVKGLDSLVATAAVNSHIACFGGTGTGIAKAINGYSPYGYQWTAPGGTNAIGTGLVAGNYTVTITDSNACSATATLVMTQPTQLTATTKITPATCGNSNGTATANPNGGVGPYVYAWAPGGQTNKTATNLSSKTYTLTVTDKNGCTTTATAVIPPSVVTAAVNATTSVSCFGGSDGTATVTPNGGISPYAYSWSPKGGTGVTATGLSVGSYTVTVTDSSGCTTTAVGTVAQPAVLVANISGINKILCNGGVGTATAAGSGGTAPYNYAWSPIGGTAAIGTGLSVGTYTVNVTDKNGCTASTKVVMTQPAAISYVVSFTKATCDQANGTASIAVAGGATPYTYAWNPSGETTATATGLKAGTYNVSVNDNNNCTASATVTVTQPTLVTASVTINSQVSCNNGADGSGSITASGGTTPYVYNWNPGGNTNANATGLFALSYTITVTDANGCTATADASLTEPTAILVNITEPRLICKDSTGDLFANASGGAPPFKYAWSAGCLATTSTAQITPITTINYSVVVTDAHGCTASAQIILQFGPSFASEITGKKSVCIGDSTFLCAKALGGVGLDTYIWEPSGNTNSCVYIAPGNVSSVDYTVAVVDGCGATSTVSTTITTDPYPSVNMYANFYDGCAPFCMQFHNASTIPLGKLVQYNWILGNGDTLSSENPLYCYKSSGQFDVTLAVTSDSGCSASLTKKGMITVYSAPQAAFTYSPQPVTILTPTVQFTDESRDKYGIAYHWWTFGDGTDSISNTTNPTHTYQDTGTYCANLIVMNARGCSDTITNCLIIGPAFTLYIPSAFTPNGNGLNDVFKPVGEYIKNFDMYIFDRWGMEIYHTSDMNTGWNGAVHGVGAICQEDTYIYKITVTDSQGTLHSYVGNVSLLK